MSNDNASTENIRQEFDLDNIEVGILIITSSVKGLEGAASFLSRRGWPTAVLSSVSQAIEYIAEKQPDFVLISLNHPNPSMAKVPDLITSSFRVTCIAFVENQDNSSQRNTRQEEESIR